MIVSYRCCGRGSVEGGEANFNVLAGSALVESMGFQANHEKDQPIRGQCDRLARL